MTARLESGELAATAPAWVRDLMGWVRRRTPRSVGGKVVATLGILSVITVLIVAALVLPLVVGTEGAVALIAAALALFVINAVASGLGVLPIPGLEIVSFLLLFGLGAIYGPVATGLGAAAGLTLGSFCMYVVGAIGLEAMRGRVAGRPKATRTMNRVVAAARRHGVWLTFATALIGFFHSLVCYAVGSAGVSFRAFGWTAVTGHAIHCLAIAGLGWLLLGGGSL